MQDIYLGRQPIHGRNLDVIAYELLFRRGEGNHANVSAGDRATSRVILNTFAGLGLERVVGNRTAFLNITRSFIVGTYPLPVPPDRVVLEVLEGVTPDAEVLGGLERLKHLGYRIALDDFVLDEGTRALLPYADIVKVDCLDQSPSELRDQVERLRPHGLLLLAEKVETQEQLDRCRGLGFDYFQGYHLSRPDVIHDLRATLTGNELRSIFTGLGGFSASSRSLRAALLS